MTDKTSIPDASESHYTISKSEILHIMSAAIGAAYVSVEDAAAILRLKTVAPIPSGSPQPVAVQEATYNCEHCGAPEDYMFRLDTAPAAPTEPRHGEFCLCPACVPGTPESIARRAVELQAEQAAPKAEQGPITENEVDAALRAACLYNTQESRTDMRKALECFAAARDAQGKDHP